MFHVKQRLSRACERVAGNTGFWGRPSARDTEMATVTSRLDARREPAFAGERLPWRGEVELVFGEPIQFAWDTDHLVATQQLEAAVAAL